jgi:hypothetical protein
MKLRILATLLSVASLQAFDGSLAALVVSGGISVNGVAQPLLFTWNSAPAIAGSGWSPGESVTILLHGPLNSPGAAPTDLTLGAFTVDAQGNFSASPTIPYDGGAIGGSAHIPRPGLYEVHATGAASGTIVAADNINLCPATYTGENAPFNWGHERGGRDGVLPGDLRQFSPERFDPEWPTVWDERPVEVYGTISHVGEDGGDQSSLISPSDAPPTHYAHDSIFFLTPDTAYQWLIGTSNYYAGDATAELGRIEVEWETLNGGHVAAYGQGNIGLPLWVNPTVGDRAYVVGRWILDAGHPELGDRTEIHPPRLLATMRKRPALGSGGAAAAQVDIYVSGHGGGANRMPSGLSDILNQGGYGGGRIKDVLSANEQNRYYQPGPLSPLLIGLVGAVLKELTGESFSLPVFSEAGPSAFPWGKPGAEEHAINDMDYDFDVPLPTAPDGATSVVMDVIQRPEHSTAVTEQVTYTNPVNGVPTTAHIHLPFKEADSGIYARSIRFSWDTSRPPANHVIVRLKQVNVKDTEGKWQLWSDVSGQWTYLSGVAPALFKTTAGQSVTVPDNPVDVFLGSSDMLRIYVQGYRAACLDDFFGKLFGQSSYLAGLAFLQQCGATNNDDLGGAVLELQPTATGSFTVSAVDGLGNSHFSVDLSVDSVP